MGDISTKKAFGKNFSTMKHTILSTTNHIFEEIKFDFDISVKGILF
jgi:hypothetical protein